MKKETKSSPMCGASRQAKWKAGQRNQGRKRMELWLTDDERKMVDEYVKSIRET